MFDADRLLTEVALGQPTIWKLGFFLSRVCRNFIGCNYVAVVVEINIIVVDARVRSTLGTTNRRLGCVVGVAVRSALGTTNRSCGCCSNGDLFGVEIGDIPVNVKLECLTCSVDETWAVLPGLPVETPSKLPASASNGKHVGR